MAVSRSIVAYVETVSTRTKLAQVVIGKAVGTKETLYDLDAASNLDRPEDDKIGEIFQVGMTLQM